MANKKFYEGGVLTKDYRLMTNDCKKKEARIEIQPRFKSNIL
jgi:hypothetical protein